MSDIKEKYIGESPLSSEPNKKLTLKLGDNTVTTSKIVDGSVTPEKLSEEVVNTVVKPAVDGAVDAATEEMEAKLNDVKEELETQIQSITAGGLVLSGNLGNRTDIGIHQKKITDEFKGVRNSIQEANQTCEEHYQELTEREDDLNQTLLENYDDLSHQLMSCNARISGCDTSIETLAAQMKEGKPVYYFTSYVEEPIEIAEGTWGGQNGDIAYVTEQNVFVISTSNGYYKYWSETPNRLSSELYNIEKEGELHARIDAVYCLLETEESIGKNVDLELNETSNMPIANSTVTKEFKKISRVVIEIDDIAESENGYTGVSDTSASDIQSIFNNGKQIIFKFTGTPFNCIMPLLQLYSNDDISNEGSYVGLASSSNGIYNVFIKGTNVYFYRVSSDILTLGKDILSPVRPFRPVYTKDKTIYEVLSDLFSLYHNTRGILQDMSAYSLTMGRSLAGFTERDAIYDYFLSLEERLGNLENGDYSDFDGDARDISIGSNIINSETGVIDVDRSESIWGTLDKINAKCNTIKGTTTNMNALYLELKNRVSNIPVNAYTLPLGRNLSTYVGGQTVFKVLDDLLAKRYKSREISLSGDIGMYTTSNNVHNVLEGLHSDIAKINPYFEEGGLYNILDRISEIEETIDGFTPGGGPCTRTAKDIELGENLGGFDSNDNVYDVLDNLKQSIDNVTEEIGIDTVPSGNIIVIQDACDQNDFSIANSIYKIDGEVSMAEDITIPAGCTLWFTGSISNADLHTLTGTDTKIIAGWTHIFENNITIAGTWNCAAKPEWFGAKNDAVDYGSWPLVHYGDRVTGTLTVDDSNDASEIEVANPQAYIWENIIMSKRGGANATIRNLKAYNRLMSWVGEVRPKSVVYYVQGQKFLLHYNNKYYSKWKNSDVWNDPVTGKVRFDTVYNYMSVSDLTYATNNTGGGSRIFIDSNNQLVESDWRTLNNDSGSAIRRAIAMTKGNVQLKNDGCYYIGSLASSNSDYIVFEGLKDFIFEGNNATLLFKPSYDIRYIKLKYCNNGILRNFNCTSVRDAFRSVGTESKPATYHAYNMVTSGLTGFIDGCSNITIDGVNGYHLGEFWDMKYEGGAPSVKYEYSDEYDTDFSRNIIIRNARIIDCDQPFFISGSYYVVIDKAHIETTKLGNAANHIIYHGTSEIGNVIGCFVHLKNSEVLVLDPSNNCAFSGNTKNNSISAQHTLFIDNCYIRGTRIMQLNGAHNAVIRDSYIEQFSTYTVALKPDEANGVGVNEDFSMFDGAGTYNLYDSEIVSIDQGRFYEGSADGQTYFRNRFHAERCKFYSNRVNRPETPSYLQYYDKDDVLITPTAKFLRRLFHTKNVIELINCGMKVSVEEIIENNPYNTATAKTIIDSCEFDIDVQDVPGYSPSNPSQGCLLVQKKAFNRSKIIGNYIIFRTRTASSTNPIDGYLMSTDGVKDLGTITIRDNIANIGNGKHFCLTKISDESTQLLGGNVGNNKYATRTTNSMYIPTNFTFIEYENQITDPEGSSLLTSTISSINSYINSLQETLSTITTPTAEGSEQEGDAYFDISTKKLMVWDGSAWVPYRTNE